MSSAIQNNNVTVIRIFKKFDSSDKEIMELTQNAKEMNRSRWILISNHGRILYQLVEDPDSTIQKMAQQTGLSVAGVQKIIASLVKNNYIVREKFGRRNHYKVLVTTPLNHLLGVDR